ncbi:MAG: hypothetical protein Q8S15_10410 [Erysipelotrichaceae bacterium]|nr:hypothetical protein [Erysipelotrichaceae bacterium]MDP3306478.1 hypothetical protein [Erysipelotrichaceae bacterium]
MNRQKNPLIGVLFFVGILFFFFASSAQSFYFIPFIFPIVFFFIVIQILAAAKKAQSATGGAAKKPLDTRYDRDFSKRTSTNALKKPLLKKPDAPRATNYGNVSNLPGAHLTKCPKCGADMDDRYDYCFKCKAWLKQ